MFSSGAGVGDNPQGCHQQLSSLIGCVEVLISTAIGLENVNDIHLMVACKLDSERTKDGLNKRIPRDEGAF